MDLIQARALNEYVYCPRLFYLMYVKGEFLDSADTLSGAAQHERAARRRRIVHDEEDSESEGGVETGCPWPEAPKELILGDDELGAVAKLDAIEQESGMFAPVEAKHGPAPKGDRPFLVEGIRLEGGAWDNDQIQLCCQGMLLQANGYPSSYGYLYYRASKKRVRVEFTVELKEATRLVIQAARRCATGNIPPPLVDSAKCIRCSLAPACLPEEVNARLGVIDEPRRIIPGRADLGMLYIVTQGARVGKMQEALSVETPGGAREIIPLKDISAVSVFGNVQVTTQALHMLMLEGRPVVYHSLHGNLLGVANGLTTKNASLRRLQVRRFDDESISLALSRSVVQSKLKNQRTLLRRNSPENDTVNAEALKRMLERIDAAGVANNLDSLRGEEGQGAKIYFERFPSMLKSEFFRQSMQGRSKRPPKDPVNAALSFGYSLLLRDLVAACVSVGFDPMIGFFHSMEAGRPALALDLMEPFRPLVVDSLVLRLINTGAIGEQHFDASPANVLLNEAGRRAFIAGYEHRMDEMITHPEFGYRLSYRRILELEARLLARFLEGEIQDYRPLTTR